MTGKEMTASNNSYDALAAVAIGIGVILIFGFFYIVLGIFTHVLGMCSGASASWTSIYDHLLYTIPLLGIIAGWLSYKSFSKNRKKKALRNLATETNSKK